MFGQRLVKLFVDSARDHFDRFFGHVDCPVLQSLRGADLQFVEQGYFPLSLLPFFESCLFLFLDAPLLLLPRFLKQLGLQLLL